MLRRSRRLSLFLKDFLHSWSALQPLIPGMKRGRLCLVIPAIHQPRHRLMPHHERQVCKCALISNKVLSALLLQVAVDDTDNALDLVAITFEHRGQILLWVEEREPRFLAVVRALAGHLEMQPGEGEPFLR